MSDIFSAGDPGAGPQPNLAPPPPPPPPPPAGLYAPGVDQLSSAIATGDGTVTIRLQPDAPLPPPTPSALIADATSDIAGDLARGESVVQAVEAEVKKYVRSRTLWSLVVSAVAAWALAHGHDIAPAAQSAIVTDILGLVQNGSLVAAGLFRILATAKLK